MAGYDCLPMKMKRKEIDRVNDEFSDFSLSSPARKIRRLVNSSFFSRNLLLFVLKTYLTFTGVMMIAFCDASGFGFAADYGGRC